MTVGITTAQANTILDTLLATNYIKLHTGDPGATATANVSANTTRVVATFASASGGSKALNGTLPAWAAWAAGNETITHISVWDAISAGNLKLTVALASGKAVTNGDTLTLNTLTASLGPLAA
jgi:hypothetical protein